MDEKSEEDRRLEAAASEKHQAYIAALRVELAEMQTPTERASALATLYCEDNSGLGIYKDQDRDRFVVRMPVDAEVEPGVIDIGGVEVIVELSRHRKAEIDAILATLSLQRWHPEVGRYGYAFSYDARTDVVDVTSNAPPEVVGALLERFPVSLTVRYGEIRRRAGRPGDPGRTRTVGDQRARRQNANLSEPGSGADAASWCAAAAAKYPKQFEGMSLTYSVTSSLATVEAWRAELGRAAGFREPIKARFPTLARLAPSDPLGVCLLVHAPRPIPQPPGANITADGTRRFVTPDGTWVDDAIGPQAVLLQEMEQLH